MLLEERNTAGWTRRGKIPATLKTTEFQILTRQRRLREATDVAERLYSVGIDLLDEFNHPGQFRLVGLVGHDLLGPNDRVQLELFSTPSRQRRLEVAIDELAARFGPDVVYRANDVTQPRRLHLTPDP
jgi:DNA polymerase IV